MKNCREILKIATAFEKISLGKKKKKKKKKTTKKWVPTSPSKWSAAKAKAKRKFDVYPCVPLESMALTKKGWAHQHELKKGDEILSYDIKSDLLRWTPIINFHNYKKAPVLKISGSQTPWTARCTPDHKWVFFDQFSFKERRLVETKDLIKKTGKILVSAPADFLHYGSSVDLRHLKRHQNLENMVIKDDGVEDVWCPETKYATWLMKQGDTITITGNSAYANLWASKEYKKQGGKWKKKSQSSSADDKQHVDELDLDTLRLWYKNDLNEVLDTEDSHEVFEGPDGRLMANGTGKDHDGDGARTTRDWLKEGPSKKQPGWVDISRTKPGGGHPPCGRPDASKGGKPKCRPAGEAKKMTKKEKESATSQKRQSERTKKRKGKKPIRDSHKKRD